VLQVNDTPRITASQLVQAVLISERSSSGESVSRSRPPFPTPLSIEAGVEVARQSLQRGIKQLVVLGSPQERHPDGRGLLDPDGIVPRFIRRLRSLQLPLQVIPDLCCCQYTTSGHCMLFKTVPSQGWVLESPSEVIDEEATRAFLGAGATVLAEAGADAVMPSSTIDGIVPAVKDSLRSAGFGSVEVWGQGAKCASNLFGGFRTASHSQPEGGTKEFYQTSVSQGAEILRRLRREEAEGCDRVLVKPALFLADRLAAFAKQSSIPLVAFLTSGEHALALAARSLGISANPLRSWVAACLRAGATQVITYDTATVLDEELVTGQEPEQRGSGSTRS
jgi:porphobilinogen synthase